MGKIRTFLRCRMDILSNLAVHLKRGYAAEFENYSPTRIEHIETAFRYLGVSARYCRESFVFFRLSVISAGRWIGNHPIFAPVDLLRRRMAASRRSRGHILRFPSGSCGSSGSQKDVGSERGYFPSQFSPANHPKPRNRWMAYKEILTSEYCNMVLRYVFLNPKMPGNLGCSQLSAGIANELQNIPYFPFPFIFKFLLWVGLQRRILPNKFRILRLQIIYFFAHGCLYKSEVNIAYRINPDMDLDAANRIANPQGYQVQKINGEILILPLDDPNKIG